VYVKSALAGSNVFYGPTTVFQTAAFVEFDRKIAPFRDHSPRTLGTLAKKHGESEAR
jgi:hypothetical protein